MYLKELLFQLRVLQNSFEQHAKKKLCNAVFIRQCPYFINEIMKYNYFFTGNHKTKSVFFYNCMEILQIRTYNLKVCIYMSFFIISKDTRNWIMRLFCTSTFKILKTFFYIGVFIHIIKSQ